MKCCEKCFRDVEVQAIIQGKKVKGNCDFCKHTDVFVYDIEKNIELTDLFDGLLDVFYVEASLPDNYPKSALNNLVDILTENWSVFGCAKNEAESLLKALCSDKYKRQPELFSLPVGIPELYDPDYLQQYSIINTSNWDSFVNNIKHVNRFYTDYINTEVFSIFLDSVKKTYPVGKIFYRARICPTPLGIAKTDMGAPPKEKAIAGRVNSDGIPCLYLADSQETTLYEIRAGVYDYVTVGRFKLLRDVNIVNLAIIDKISPFQEIDLTQLAVNIEHLKLISREIAKPLRRHDSPLDYLPTQYVSDFIKSLNYDGIEYISTMCPVGFNLALFDGNTCECIDTEVFDIESLKYKYKPI